MENNILILDLSVLKKKRAWHLFETFSASAFFPPLFLQAGSACCVAIMASLPALPTQTLQDLPVSLYVNGSMDEDLTCFCLRFLGRGKMWHENYETSCFGLHGSCSHAFEGQATLSAKCISQLVTETILVHAVQLAVSHSENVTESLKNM